MTLHRTSGVLAAGRLRSFSWLSRQPSRPTRVFALEHSPLAYAADFVFYGVLTASLAMALVVFGFGKHPVQLAAIVGTGAVAWTLFEYAIHRFVLHGLRPFSDWHAEHHQRPMALICAPTLVSAALIVAVVLLPALLWAGHLRAGALTLGVLAGYLAYSTMHHAAHHWRPSSGWARACKRRHAQHHRPAGRGGHYGVTSGFWDRVFATAPPIDSSAATRTSGFATTLTEPCKFF